METILVVNDDGESLDLNVINQGKEGKFFCPQCETKLDDPIHMCIDGTTYYPDNLEEIIGIKRRDYKRS